VDLNREYVTLQETQQQLVQVLSDPQQRAEFLAALDGNTNNNQQQQQQQQPVERPTFPGGAPGQQQQPASLEQYYQKMQELTAAGFPVDNLNSVYQGWDGIPDEAWRQLAPTLIRGAF
jgi:hypothetical protein